MLTITDVSLYECCAVLGLKYKKPKFQKKRTEMTNKKNEQNASFLFEIQHCSNV